jgi:hypothetical protein
MSESVVNLWYGFGSVGTAVLLAPLLGAFFPALRPERRFAAGGMGASGAVALAWVLSAQGGGTPWFSIEPVFPGLAVAALFAAAGIVARRFGSRREA